MPAPADLDDDSEDDLDNPSTGFGVDIAALRDLCMRLLADVPARQRVALIDQMDRHFRRTADLPALRLAVFGLIEKYHGDAAAQERVSQFDMLIG